MSTQTSQSGDEVKFCSRYFFLNEEKAKEVPIVTLGSDRNENQDKVSAEPSEQYLHGTVLQRTTDYYSMLGNPGAPGL